MDDKTCCVTGHRDIPKGLIGYVEAQLRRETVLAIAEGYTSFYSGFAQGADLIFAEIVAELCHYNPGLRLYAAIPHRQRYDELMSGPDTRRLLEACRYVAIISEEASASTHLHRNRFMVEHSSRVIAVYDGRQRGGTASTLRLARSMGRGIRLISI